MILFKDIDLYQVVYPQYNIHGFAAFLMYDQ